jgi:bifunctional DNase/RNase
VTDETEASNPANVFRVAQLRDVSYDLLSPSPTVTLFEAESPHRVLEIPMGLQEAIALANALSKTAGKRPSTHELFTETLQILKADIAALRITQLQRSVYYAELDLMTPQGRFLLDCRASDGFILAMRQNVAAPILVAESVFRAAARADS